MEKFLYKVNEAGLPKDWCFSESSGYENVKPLSPQEVAKLYWLLKSVRVKYAYTIDGLRTQREVLMESKKEPKKRILSPERFQAEGEDSLIELDMGGVIKLSEGGYGLELSIVEAVNDGNEILNTLRSKRHRILGSMSTDFMGNRVELTLHTKRKKAFGSVDEFAVELEFFECGADD